MEQNRHYVVVTFYDGSQFAWGFDSRIAAIRAAKYAVQHNGRKIVSTFVPHPAEKVEATLSLLPPA